MIAVDLIHVDGAVEPFGVYPTLGAAIAALGDTPDEWATVLGVSLSDVRHALITRRTWRLEPFGNDLGVIFHATGRGATYEGY